MEFLIIFAQICAFICLVMVSMAIVKPLVPQPFKDPTKAKGILFWLVLAILFFEIQNLLAL